MDEKNKYYHNIDYNVLYRQALKDAIDKKLLNIPEETIEDIMKGKDIENVYVLFLSIYAKIISDYYLNAQEIYESNDIKLAEGNDLDIIGLKLGLPRYEPTKASTIIEFTTSDILDHTVVVEEGVELISDTGQTYTTDESFIFDSSVKTARVNATSNGRGSGVRVKTGELDTIITEIPGINIIFGENIIPSIGGKDAESDEDYRTRLINWRLIEQKGNEYAYRNVLDNFDGLDDYQLIPKWDGAGTVKVVLKEIKQDTTSIGYTRKQVYDALQEKAVRFDEDLTIISAPEYPINIYCNINVDYDVINPYSLTEKEDIKNRTVQAIKDYVAQLKIGEDFIPFKCGVYLDEVFEGIKNIDFTSPKNPIVIEDESVITLSDVDVIMD